MTDKPMISLDDAEKLQSADYDDLFMVFTSGSIQIQGIAQIRKGSGKAVCRACGELIKKDEKCIYFNYDFVNQQLNLLTPSNYTNRVYIHYSCDGRKTLYFHVGQEYAISTIRRKCRSVQSMGEDKGVINADGMIFSKIPQPGREEDTLYTRVT